WCQRHLGAAPVVSLLRAGHLSAVFGLRLGNGRDVVVKARRDEPGRVASCVAAQAALAGNGFRCPAPLTSVTSLASDLVVNAEEWLPSGELLRGDDRNVARCYAAV